MSQTDRTKLARPFDHVLEEELSEIAALRERRGVATSIHTEGEGLEPAHRAQLVGLAFSGGGIRSATFNLGILQGLARLGLLKRFDYLSTVSGGGYIGSWLVTWIRREGAIAGLRTPIERVTEGLCRSASREPDDRHEPPEIQHLRSYSNYLTPRPGVFTTDTAHVLAVVVRNILLTLLVFLLALSALLLAFRSVGYLVGMAAAVEGRMLALTIVVVIILALLCIGFGLLAHGITMLNRRTNGWPGLTPPWVLLGIVAPLLVSGFVSAQVLFTVSDDVPLRVRFAMFSYPALVAIGSGIEPFVRSVVGWFARPLESEKRGRVGRPREESARVRRERWKMTRVALIGAVVAGVIGGGGLTLLTEWMAHWPRAPERAHVAYVYGGPLFMLNLLVTITLHVGFAGRGFKDESREWVARISGSLAMWTALAALLLCAVFEGPRLVDWMGGWLQGAAAVAWGAGTIAGLQLARKATHPGLGRRLLVSMAPWVFLAGLLLMLGWSLRQEHLVQLWAGICVPRPAIAGIPLALVAGGLAWVLARQMGVNEFSLHALYRNRLARCYLGASRRNRSASTNPWTDLDPKDDEFTMAEFSAERGYAGPYPLINTTLNLVAGSKLAWQTRKAASFVFAPRFSGFVASPNPDDPPLLEKHGYRDSEAFAGGPSLGTAMAISGAAVSPNMGRLSSVPVGLLMTLFNIRLGWWLGNPRHAKHWRDPEPRYGLFVLLREMFGLTNQLSPYVHLSDGGHFENLGIYELVRRRCRFVVACDAEQDRARNFGGLGTAIELCRRDFGVDIEIDLDALRPIGESGHSRWHCAIGSIRYDRRDPFAPAGTLVYLKASLTGREPTDVQRYAAREPHFPHQATTDQWFDETQFESYRALGEHIADEVFGSIELGKAEERSTEQIFVDLAEHWHATLPDTGTFSRHGEALSRIQRRIREDVHTRFLEDQIYTEWRHLVGSARHIELGLPQSYEKTRAGFFLCAEMLQLMENVYLDLDLEHTFRHPDHRGWMNLFQRWSWSSMFRATWAISASTYGARFQEFCRRRLGLGLGDIQVRELERHDSSRAMMTAIDLHTDQSLTFLERRLLLSFLGSCQHLLDAPAQRLQLMDVFLTLQSPVASRTSDDGANMLELRVGFALVAVDRQQARLLYFRIQNHLRMGGLGGEALQRLREWLRQPPEDAGRVELQLPENLDEVFDSFRRSEPPPDELPSERDVESFRTLFDSALSRGRRPAPKGERANRVGGRVGARPGPLSGDS